MKKLVAVAAISLLLALVAIAYAQGPGMMGAGMMGEGSEMDPCMMGRGDAMGPGMMGEHPILNKLVGLGLDAKQKEAVKEIVRTNMKETIKKRADLSIARIDLKDLLDKDSVNMKVVESKLKQIGSLEADIRLLHIKAVEAIKSKLTPDQRMKLKETIEQGMMTGRMSMMQGKGCGMMGGMMQHGNMETATPPAEKSEEMPGMEHSH